MHRLTVIAFLVLLTASERVISAGDDPMLAVTEQAAVLDAAPRLAVGKLELDGEALAETFAAWAEVGGGTYFDANGAEALERSIADALRPRFDIVRTYLDGRTEVVGHATLGEQVTVPAGLLTITPGSGASGTSITLQVQPQASTEFEYAPDIGLMEMEK